jgi:hypothetical protein
MEAGDVNSSDDTGGARAHEPTAQRMISPFALIWAGIVIGVSFLATPIKFTADSLTRPVALDVGRATFHALAYLEWTLTLALAFGLWNAFSAGHRPSLITAGAAAVVGGAVALQAFWLMPALDDRVAAIIAGTEPAPSHLHTAFGATEVAKVAALVSLGLTSRSRLRVRP